MTGQPMTPTISTAQVLDGNLPEAVTGVHWADTEAALAKLSR